MKKFRLLIMVSGISLLALLMISCSFSRSFYVINKTNQDWTITIRIDTSIEVFDSKHDFEGALPYLDDIDLEMESGVRQLLTKKLRYQKLDDQTLQIKLPATSTVYVGGRSSNDHWMYESFTFTSPGKEITITENEIPKKFQKDKLFGFGPMYYVIE